MTIAATAAARTLLAVTLVAGAGCERGANGHRATPPGEPRVARTTGQLSQAAPLPHATDFLTAGCFTHVYAGLDSAGRDRCRAAIASRNYTHFYLYPYNEADYGGPMFNFYETPYRFRERLIELKQAGLEPVVWLVPDDAQGLTSRPVGVVRAMFEQLIPVVDDLVSSYVLGLELDEYWSSATVNSLGARLSQLTHKPIAVHQTPGRWDYCKFDWCDYMVLQYGFETPLEDIERMTRGAIRELRKPVVAGEYEAESEVRAVTRGDRGVAAGGAGFGNGGTPARPMQNAPSFGPDERE